VSRFLVLGASGFLGRHIRARLESVPDAEVVTAGRTGGEEGGRHVVLDLAATTAAELSLLLVTHVPDVVVNAAGLTVGEPQALVATNIGGTFTLIEALRRARPYARLVHLGSAAEYGRVPERVPVAEGTAPDPVSAYGVSKLAATHLVALARGAGLDAVVLRVFNPVGPGAPATSLPGRVVRELGRTVGPHQAIELGPLTGHRDFVDARDVAEAVAAAALAPSLPCPVLNVGSGTATPIKALVDQLVRLARFSGFVRQGAPGSARSPDVPWQQADIRAIEAALGWTPRIDLATSLQDMWLAATQPLTQQPVREYQGAMA
jgi:nucleoside-diphosphate-sugar epimerase